MEKLWKKISGLFFASVMAVTLTGKANAENDEAALPEAAPTAVVESAPDPGQAAGSDTSDAEKPAGAPSDPDETPAAPADEAPAASQSETPAVTSEEMPVEAPAAEEIPVEAPAGGSADSTEEFESGTETVSESDTAGVFEYEESTEEAPAAGVEAAADDAEDASDEAAVEAFEAAEAAPEEEEAVIMLTPDGEGSLTRYAARAGVVLRSVPEETPSQVINLVTESVSNITTTDDILIQTAGYQHITSLISDGNVHIVGTGILLVDEVDLLMDRELFLHPIQEIYGDNGGTVALFILTGEADGVKTYTLVNGRDLDNNQIPAILDEEYTIPGGISLVVPSEGKLILQPVNKGVKHSEEGPDETVYSTTGIPAGAEENSIISTAPKLTVGIGANLVIKSGASFQLSPIDNGDGGTVRPTLTINGGLTLDTVLKKGFVVFGPSSTLGGEGSFLSSQITVDSDENGRSNALDLTVADTWIHLQGNGADLSTLTVNRADETSNYNMVMYEGDPSVGTLDIDSGVTLILRSASMVNKRDALEDSDVFGSNDALRITHALRGGGTVELRSGTVVVSAGTDIADSTAVTVGSDVVGPYAATVYDYTRPTPGTASVPGLPRIEPDGICTDSAAIPVVSFELEGNADLVAHFLPASIKTDYTQYPRSGVISYASLAEQYGVSALNGRKVLLEVCSGGEYSYVFLSGSANYSAANVERIYLYKETFDDSGIGGGGVTTDTNTSFTGSGVLGGSGAGSVSGGARRLAITGDRTDPISLEPDPKPDPEPAPTPAQAAEDLRVWTEERNGGYYLLNIERGGKALGRLAARVKVQMEYTPGTDTEGMPMYAVFRDVDGTLTAFEASYDPITGMLSFSSNISGKFIIVAFDFDGEPFTEEFYRALADLDAVGALIA